MNQKILVPFVLALMFLAFFAGLARYRQLDAGGRIYCVLVGITAVVESIAMVISWQHRSNLPLYGIFSIVEMCMICLYFNASIDLFRKNNGGVYLAIACAVIGVGSIIWLQPLTEFNSYFLYFEGVLTISLCLFSFARMMLQHSGETYVPIYYSPHFWISSVLAFFWATTFCIWGVEDYVWSRYRSHNWMISLSIDLTNFVNYASVATIFWIYPKMLSKT